jgi:hypothetical protein
MPGPRHPIRIGRKSALLLLVLFGVTPERAWARIGDGQVIARFGWWWLRVPISAVASWRIEGPWRWITAIGVRRGIRHGDVSFAGSPRGGVRLDFHAPVRWGIFRAPAFYLGVDDLEGFAAELSALGIPGHDARAI